MNPAKSQANQGFPFQDIIARILFLLGALVVYRLGVHIPVPGVDVKALGHLFDAKHSFFGLINLFSGGALKRFSVFALGLMPYISASIVMQLLTAMIPSFEDLKKDGSSGKRKLTAYTRQLTIVICLVQGSAVLRWLLSNHLVVTPNWFTLIAIGLSLTTGTMFLMWLGEQLTERGLGNGISFLIFAGICSNLPTGIGRLFQSVREGSLPVYGLLLILVMMFALLYLVCMVERAQRRIPIEHPPKHSGRRMAPSQVHFLPLKINMAGVVPPIFASAILLFPATILQFLAPQHPGRWFSYLQQTTQYLLPGHWLYTILFIAALAFFCFFYAALVYEPAKMADQLKRQQAFVPGIRPGKMTADYLDKVMTRLSMLACVYLSLVCLFPQFMQSVVHVSLYFGGTSLLIIVVVVFDLVNQVQSRLLSQQYKGFFQKMGHTGMMF